MNLLKLFRRKEEPLNPLYPKERPPCPFYGFHSHGQLMVDQSGNECALIFDRFAPCQMDVWNETPNWRYCSMNNPAHADALNGLRGLIKVFPDEFGPRKKGWRGISLGRWMDYVMAQTKLPKTIHLDLRDLRNPSKK
jgi:hypothetical protein